MPQLLRDSTVVPVPKNNKDASVSTNYRPIALSSTLSKVLEQLILCIFSRAIICSLVSNLVVLLPFVLVWLKTLFLDIFTMDLRFLVVSWMPLKLLTQLIMVFSSRNCPTEVFLLAVVRFLLSWYSSQECCVRWGSCCSRSFSVSNGVHQGSVLSPLLFALYLDDLLSDLAESGVGCYWGNMFAGCLCYADDIVLLAPCQSALRIMLKICCDYASNNGLGVQFL